MRTAMPPAVVSVLYSMPQAQLAHQMSTGARFDGEAAFGR
jgi:hypothetical protein